MWSQSRAVAGGATVFSVRGLVLVALVDCLAAGCGAQLAGGSDNNVVTPDASGGGSGSSSGHDAGVSSHDASGGGGACANGRVIYLAFDGETLTHATQSDATQHKASWIGAANVTVPSFHPGSSTRAADLQTVVDGVKSRLAGTPIQIVTTRPATGPFVEVVFGGTKTDVASIYGQATNFHDCGDTVKSDVAWVSEQSNLSFTADLAVGAIGWGLGLDGTLSTADCMCGWANNCSSAAGACTLSQSIATSITYTSETACPNNNPQNEVAAFTTLFCQ